MEGSQLLSRLENGARYQSAEGCYALAVSKRKDLRVKYAVKVFTDADGDSDLRREVVLSNGLILKPAYSGQKDTPLLSQPPPSLAHWLISPNVHDLTKSQNHKQFNHFMRQNEEVYDLKNIKLLTKATRSAHQKCMYWVGGNYQTCMDNVKEMKSGALKGMNIHFINGIAYQVPYETKPYQISSFQQKINKNISIISGVFFHFQEWKKQFKSWATHLPPHGLASQGVLATKDGFIPLPFSKSASRPLHHKNEEFDDMKFPWIYRSRGALKYCFRFEGSKCKSRFHASDLKLLPFTEENIQQPLLHKNEEEESSLIKRKKLKTVSHSDVSSIGIFLDNLKSYDNNDVNDITLLVAVWLFISEERSEQQQTWLENKNLIRWMAEAAFDWLGPKSIVIGVCDEESEIIEKQIKEEFNLVYNERCELLNDKFLDFIFMVRVACDVPSSSVIRFSEKSLLNSATDLSITRYVLALPVGVMVSSDTYSVLVRSFEQLRDNVVEETESQMPKGGGVSILIPLYEADTIDIRKAEFNCLNHHNQTNDMTIQNEAFVMEQLSDVDILQLNLQNHNLSEFIGKSIYKCINNLEESFHKHPKPNNGLKEFRRNDKRRNRRRRLLGDVGLNSKVSQDVLLEAMKANQNMKSIEQIQTHFQEQKFRKTSSSSKKRHQSERRNKEIEIENAQEKKRGNMKSLLKCELMPASSGDWFNDDRNVSPDSKVASPLIAYDLFTPFPFQQTPNEGNSKIGRGGGRDLSSRWIEELPNGCLDAAQAWAYKELGGSIVSPSDVLPKEHAYGLYSTLFMRKQLNVWDCGCSNTGSALDVWASYKRYIRRAVAFYEAALAFNPIK